MRASIDSLAKMLWDYHCLNLPVTKADVMICLGSHDTMVPLRGAELYAEGVSPIIVCSGGFGRLTDKDWQRPEAEIFADILKDHRVPDKHILIENKSTNTAENLSFSMQLLAQKNIFPKNILVIHSPFMERRPVAIWKKLFPDIQCTVTSPQFSFEQYPKKSGIPKEEIINTLVGETDRVKLYPSQGYMVFQEIPDVVWQANTQLKTQGFTKYSLLF